MCGISGIVSRVALSESEMRLIIRKMGLWQYHRGPDAWGEWVTPHVALGHNRLSIIDLEYGHQPMSSADGRVKVIFNGEIYNYRSLWEQLLQKGCNFKTDHSDTEVIVNGYLEWGTDLFFRLDGMFALGIWDDRYKILILARDRIGIKPLYTAALPKGGVIFASEPKALLGSNLVEPVFRPEGLAEYFLSRAPCSPNTMMKSISKVSPGSYVTFDHRGERKTEKRFWQIQTQPVLDLPYSILEERLGVCLSGAVKTHLISDVPLGIFLSGGIDSSLVAAFTAREISLNAFNIGSDSIFDETTYAKVAAEVLTLPLHTRKVTSSQFIDKLDDWTYVNDDPSSDPSALALMILAEDARKSGMKVMIAGEGGDELFGGYYSYVRYLFFHSISKLPFASNLSHLVPATANSRNADYLRNIGNLHFMGTGHLTDFNTLRDILDPELHYHLNRISKNGTSVSQMCDRPLRSALITDQMFRLPDDLLMRTDRATMFYALETRVPYLDNHVIDFANLLPDSVCVRLLTCQTKIILKSLALNYIPYQAIYRRKRGFDLPLSEWIAGPFLPIIRQVVSERLIPGLNYLGGSFLVSKFLAKKSATLAGRLWAWMIMELWYRLWVKKEASPRVPNFLINRESFSLLK